MTSFPLKKVFIANRAEIARRILWAARELGMRTVAAFSDADVALPHMAECDEVVRVGPAEAALSYLNMDALIEAALTTGCDCVHPGYGFLSENPVFADKVIAAGLRWVGPRPNAIRAIGDKTAAKRIAMANDVPITEWFPVDFSKLDEAVAKAEKIGFPLIIKPAGGGGGKGMYVVRHPDELLPALEKSRYDAVKAFGRGELLIEKFIENPRHIEVQILADEHGTVLHLGERECSIQRRQQKLIEESPSPALTPQLRELVTAAAVRAATAAGYTSAGTCEFLFEPATQRFYFLEMNTRLQVEHPVTEGVTRIDLCKAMFRIAAGERLWFSQSDVQAMGHCIEFRIIAEDPANGFLPSLGPIKELVTPHGPGVRVDGGYGVGNEVSVHYDSLIAKLIVWGQDRDEAMIRGERALRDFHVLGVQTCIPFHLAMLKNAEFRAGSFSIHTVDALLKSGVFNKRDRELELAAAVAVALELLGAKSRATAAFDRAVMDKLLQASPQVLPSSTAAHPSVLANENDPWRLSGRPRGRGW